MVLGITVWSCEATFSEQLTQILNDTGVCDTVRVFLKDTRLATVGKFFYSVDSLDSFSRESAPRVVTKGTLTFALVFWYFIPLDP